MVTTFVTITPHLAEYAKSIFFVPNENYIQVPQTEDFYHMLANLMQKCPKNCELPTEGNLEIALPARSGGKCVHVYNYISIRSAEIIEKKIESLFWAHLHEFIDEYRQKIRKESSEPVFYIKDCVHMFMQAFRITAVTEGALVKNYYRWKDSTRRQLKKRGYSFTENKRKSYI